ncbi:MAG TPA: antibiotic biosynthesis monooxygenase [Chloroflexota bacterium]|nr:antibiotic biosynthesis monooxygenase [Chloroflexota bacterium]
MGEVAIIRRIFLLPGREAEGIHWLEETEPIRRRAGQLRQYVVRGLIDPQEYQWVQRWSSYEAYDGWRRSPARRELADQRGRFMTHQPSSFYDVLE